MAGYLEIADSQVGYREEGGHSNITKYWAELDPGLQGQPWCACFVSWCLVHAGQISAIGGSPMYSCTAMMKKAKSFGQWASTPVVGCLAIYDFGSGSPAHVEFVTAVVSGGIGAIGGNTSGGYVAHKTRSLSAVLGYWHIEAPVGSIPIGSGGSGPVSIVGNGTRYPPAAETITGEGEDIAVRFAGQGRFVSA